MISLRRSKLYAAFLCFAVVAPGESEGRGVEKGLVMIFSQYDQEAAEQIGSGFVVGFDQRATYLLTAAHVVTGDPRPRIRFAIDPHSTYLSTVIRVDRSADVAALRIEGYVPDSILLPFDSRELAPADPLYAIGFPERALQPRWISASLSADEGGRFVLDKPLAEGHSGGPVLRNSLVVGMVKETNISFAYAIPAPILHRILQGWRIPVKLQTSAVPTVTRPSRPERSEPVEEELGLEDSSLPEVRLSPGQRAFPCHAEVTSLSGGTQPVRIAASQHSNAPASLPMGTQVQVRQRLPGGGHYFYEILYRTSEGSGRGWMRGDHLRLSAACP